MTCFFKWHQQWYIYICIYIYIYIYIYSYFCFVYIYTQITWYDWYGLWCFMIWELGSFLIFIIADYPHKLSHYIGPISFQCFAFLLVPLGIFRWFHFGCSDLPMAKKCQNKLQWEKMGSSIPHVTARLHPNYGSAGSRFFFVQTILLNLERWSKRGWGQKNCQRHFFWGPYAIPYQFFPWLFHLGQISSNGCFRK